jgi:hypothetical protein
MPFAMTCTCGARLEIDDKFAGQTITCPDCQQSLSVSANGASGRRTSGLALSSMVLALVGAFTVVGTVAAVLVGVLALQQISKRADRFAGKGYAIAGIVIGIVMTAGTLIAISSIELLGLPPMLSDAVWAGKLDFSGPLEVVREQEGFAIKRPSERWGVYKPPLSRANGDLNQSVWDDLLLVLPSDDTIVLCFAVRVSPEDSLAKCRDKLEREFREMEKVGLFHKSGRGFGRGTTMVTRSTKWPPTEGKVEMVEMLIDKNNGGEDKSFLARVIKSRGDDRMYVVIGGARRGRFARVEGQIREAMDSFRLLPRNAVLDW